MIGVTFTCTGNNGRSPVAEAVAGDYCDKNYAQFAPSLSISSNGTDRNWIERRELIDFDKVSSLIRNGVAYNEASPGFYTPEQHEFSQNLLIDFEGARARYHGDTHFRDVAKELARQTREMFGAVEQQHRDIFLKERGLRAKGEQTALQVRDDIHYVLCMGHENVAAACAIYNGSDDAPHIGLLTDFVGEQKEIPEVFGDPKLEAYSDLFTYVAYLARKSIDKVVEREFRL